MGIREFILYFLAQNSKVPKVIIKNTKNTTFQNVTFFTSEHPVDLGLLNRELIVPNYAKEITESRVKLTSMIERERRLVEKLDKVLTLYNLHNDITTIRFWGMYSGYSTIRSSYDYSEMSVLEREEKRLLIELAKSGFTIKMILTLNIETVLMLGFTMEEIKERIDDFCRTCRELKKYNNFDFAIDSPYFFDSTIAIDGISLMKQSDFADKSNYNKSYWTSSKQEIQNFCYDFEKRFSYLKNIYYQSQQILRPYSYEDYVKHIMEIRLKNIIDDEK